MHQPALKSLEAWLEADDDKSHSEVIYGSIMQKLKILEDQFGSSLATSTQNICYDLVCIISSILDAITT